MAKKSAGAARRESPTPRFFQGSNALSRVLPEVLGWLWDTAPRPDASLHLRKHRFLDLCVKLAYLRLRPNKADMGETRTFFDRKLPKVFEAQLAISKGRTVIG